MTIDDPRYVLNTKTTSNMTRKHRHESALNTAAHILVCLTQEGKSSKEIAREDFDNNLELVSVWVDYMFGINWIYKNISNGSNNNNNREWIATDKGKKWVEKILLQYKIGD